MNSWNQAVSDLNQAAAYAKQLPYWRGLTQADGLSILKMFFATRSEPERVLRGGKRL